MLLPFPFGFPFEFHGMVEFKGGHVPKLLFAVNNGFYFFSFLPDPGKYLLHKIFGGFVRFELTHGKPVQRLAVEPKSDRKAS